MAARKTRHPLLLFVCLVSFLISADSQPAVSDKPQDPVSSGRVAFTHFTDHNGLPQNAIQAMAFDKKGYLWIGSQDGAAYYNGRNWTVVNMPNRTISNFVRAILVADDESIWFGRQEGGVARLKDGNWTTFDEQSGLPDKRVNALLETRANDGSSIIWIGTDRGLAQLRNGQITRADNNGPLPTERVTSLVEARTGDGSAVVWAGNETGLVRFSNGERKTITTSDGLPSDRVTALLATKDANGQSLLWIGTRAGLIRYEVNDNRFSLIDAKAGLPPNTIVCLAETIAADRTSVLWAGTDAGGLLRLQNGSWTIFTTRDGLSSNSVFSVLPSSGASVTETLWIGTDGGGLARLNFGGWRSFSTANGLPVNSVFCIFETQDSNGPAMWFGTYGGGLARLQNGTWTIFDRSSGMADNTVFEMLETTLDDGRHVLWAGMKGGGLTRFDNGRWVRGDVEKGFGESTVRSMLATTDDDGSRVVWAASGGRGLGRLAKNKWTFFDSTNGLPHNSVFEMAETIDPDGSHVLWVATGGGGIAHFAKGQWRVLDVTSGLPSNSVLSLLIDHARDNKTYLWAGTEGGGLARLELNATTLDAPRWLTFSDSTSPALPNNTIYQVRKDSRGAIYVSHNKGVSRLIPRYEGDTVSYDVNTFTTEDGLPANEGNGGVSLVDSKGRIWFGTVGGAAVFDPSEEVVKQTPSRLYIEKTFVGDRSTIFGPSQTLPHDQNHISFEYALMSFAHEDATRYSTQLVGLENVPTGWTTDGKRDFSSLQPGNYTFKVWGKDSTGNITGPVAVSFTIKPPLTRTWGAYALYLAVLVGLAFAVFRLRTRSLRRRNDWLQERINERTRELAEKVEELRESEQRAYTHAQVKSRFLANMSHEIRTPINGVIGMTNLLLDTSLTPEQRARAEVVNRSGNILLTIVNDILDFSKIEAGKLTLESIDFDLNLAIADVLELVAGKAESKGLELRSVIESDVPPFIKGDPIRLRQVLINLVDNAIKFTASGAISVHVRLVETRDELSVLRFEVSDTGIGVKPEDVDDLFTAFTQADSSTTRRYGGTGLGLTIAKQLVELMNGEIGADSNGANPGSTFWFTAQFAKSTGEAAHLIALEKTDLYRDGVEPRRRKKSTHSTIEPIIAPALRKLPYRLLLVDDNRTNQDIVVMNLAQLGFEVDRATNGKEAIEALKRTKYDLVFMDCHMPEMDGFEATATIRLNEHPGHRIPIIAMTASALPEDRERCLAVGMDDFLAKPLNRSDLCETLQRWLNVRLDVEEDESPVAHDALQKLRQLGGANDSFLAELIDVFHSESLERLEQMREAAAKRDLAKLHDVAHTHRGASINFGAQKMAELCQRVESSTTTEPELIQQTIAEIESEFIKVSRVLHEERINAPQ